MESVEGVVLVDAREKANLLDSNALCSLLLWTVSEVGQALGGEGELPSELGYGIPRVLRMTSPRTAGRGGFY